MKLLIASDIHGDADCCRALLNAAERENAEKILILGDILYHGPRNDLPEGYAPKKVIEMLNAASDKLLCVRGNCDTEVDQMVLSFPILSDTAFVYDGEEKLTLYMSHGHKYSPDNLPPISGRAVFLYGHTHILGKTEKDGIPCVNPGSVSLPKGGNDKTYAVYESGKITVKTLDGTPLESYSF
jgi:putative phosphoesterase